jgi:hypothetical protein
LIKSWYKKISTQCHVISVTHTHTHIYNIMYIDCHSHLSFSARVFSVTGGCGFNDCRRSFRLLVVFLVFIWTFTFASCRPLRLVAVVTARDLKDDVIGIGWVWQKLLSRTHLSKQLTSLIGSFFVSDGGVGFRGQIEPMWSRLVGVVNAVEVHVVIERPEEAWSGA